MNKKLFLLIVPLFFSGCYASLSVDKPREVTGTSELNEKLLEAADNGSLEVIISLLKQGINPNACDTNGSTAIHLVAQYGHIDCLKALIEAKADLSTRNKYGDTALHYAAHNGHVDCVKTLIQAGADLNAHNILGNTALHDSASRGHVVCVQALLEAKTDINAANNKGSKALHKAAAKGHVVCVQILLEAKADINAVNNEGSRALHKAAAKGHVVCVQILLEANADLNAGDNHGKTALHWAAQKGHLVCVKILVHYSYRLVPSKELVSKARKRISEILFHLALVRKNYPYIDDYIKYEILTWNKFSHVDLVIILLDELNKGRELKSIFLILSKDAAVSYLNNMVEEMIRRHVEVENLRDLIRVGLNERIEQLKATLIRAER